MRKIWTNTTVQTVTVALLFGVLGVLAMVWLSGNEADARSLEMPTTGMDCSADDCYVYNAVTGQIQHVVIPDAHQHYQYLEPVYFSKEEAEEARKNKDKSESEASRVEEDFGIRTSAFTTRAL